jgi:nucleotide-binding universal stress UspA family protein
MATGADVPVVVGIDGSPSASRAAVWAAREAVLLRRPLTLVYAYEWPADEGPGRTAFRANPIYREAFLGYARERIGWATERVRNAVPEVHLTAELVVGRPVTVLTERSAQAALVVLGSRGFGGVSGLLLGSVAIGLVSHAHCPVVIVREDERHPENEVSIEAGAPVVVGIDGSPMSEAALAYAFGSASVHGAPLVAVHAWRLDAEDSRLVPYINLDTVCEEEEALAAEQLAGWADKYPDVPVRRMVVNDRPSRALLQQSSGARLLVVGARGRGGMAGLLLGSTSQALIHRAACPVAVVRPPADTIQGDR